MRKEKLNSKRIERFLSIRNKKETEIINKSKKKKK